MIELLNIDCMEYMKTVPDKYFDLAIVDPPYGIGKFWSGGDSKFKNYRKDEPDWNQNVPSNGYFKELDRVSKKHIVWGWNYYTEQLGSSNNLIIWEKGCSYKTNYSEVEIAFCSFKIVCQIIKVNLVEKNTDNISYHPCAKPIKLYKEVLNRFAKPEMKILDTHGGSFSSAIACYDFGTVEYVGCELYKDYYDAAVKRFEYHKSQVNMFERTTGDVG